MEELEVESESHVLWDNGVPSDCGVRGLRSLGGAWWEADGFEIP